VQASVARECIAGSGQDNVDLLAGTVRASICFGGVAGGLQMVFSNVATNRCHRILCAALYFVDDMQWNCQDRCLR
jgi:hypothetical protein